MNVQYLWSDVWLLLAIIYAGKEQPARLADVIFAADMINHALPTFEEIEGALSRLTTGGFVVDSNGRFSPSAKTMAYYQSVTKPHRPYHKEEEDLQKLLNALPWSPSIRPRDANIGASYPWLTADRLKKADREYRSMWHRQS